MERLYFKAKNIFIFSLFATLLLVSIVAMLAALILTKDYQEKKEVL